MAGTLASALHEKAASLLRPLGWPEAGRDLAEILRYRAVTWVTVPRPVPPERTRACLAAVKLLDEAARLEPRDPRSYVLRAAANLWLDRESYMRRDIRMAYERGSKDPLVCLWRSYISLKDNDPEGALRACDRAVSSKPCAWGYCMRGEARLRTGHPVEALADLETCLKLDPSRPWAFVLRAEAHRDMRRYDAALAELDRLVKLHPTSWSYAIRARTAFNFRDKRKALADLDYSVKLDPKFWEGYTYRGEAYRRLGRLREALRDQNKALGFAPHCPARIKSWRGATLMALGKFDEAIEDLTPVIDSDPEPLISWALTQRAHCRLMLGRFKLAFADMNRAVAIDPKNGWIYGHPGREGGTLDRHDEMTRRLTGAVKRRPRWAWAYAWRGETHGRAGHHAEAIADLDRAIKLDPSQAWFWAWRGLARRGLGDRAAAASDFGRCIRLNKRYPAVHGWRAELLMEDGRYAEAARSLDSLLNIDLRSAWAWAWRGECRLKCGDARGAKSDLEDAVNLDMLYADAWAWLAEAKRQLGDLPGALKAADRALELKGDKALAYLVRAGVNAALGRERAQVSDFKNAARLRPDLLRDKARSLGLESAVEALGLRS